MSTAHRQKESCGVGQELSNARSGCRLTLALESSTLSVRTVVAGQQLGAIAPCLMSRSTYGASGYNKWGLRHTFRGHPFRYGTDAAHSCPTNSEAQTLMNDRLQGINILDVRIHLREQCFAALPG